MPSSGGGYRSDHGSTRTIFLAEVVFERIAVLDGLGAPLGPDHAGAKSICRDPSQTLP